jgi:general secretion pathway protein B
MSYILDALRRADAERDRGAVPSLHSQQFGSLSNEEEAAPHSRLMIGIIAVLALALAGVLGWVLFAGSDSAPKTVASGAVAPAPLPVAVAPAPVAPPAPLPTPSAPPVAAAPAKAVAASVPAAATKRPAPRPAVRPEAAPAETAAASSAASSAGAERVYAQADLPEAIRRDLPKLAFGGASYSSDKASRLVFLNGQVFHEGDTVVSGVVVRQIRQKGAVLSFKGYRYEVGF